MKKKENQEALALLHEFWVPASMLLLLLLLHVSCISLLLSMRVMSRVLDVHGNGESQICSSFVVPKLLNKCGGS